MPPFSLHLASAKVSAHPLQAEWRQVCQLLQLHLDLGRVNVASPLELGRAGGRVSLEGPERVLPAHRRPPLHAKPVRGRNGVQAELAVTLAVVRAVVVDRELLLVMMMGLLMLQQQLLLLLRRSELVLMITPHPTGGDGGLLREAAATPFQRARVRFGHGRGRRG